jgi:hypothetical protein
MEEWANLAEELAKLGYFIPEYPSMLPKCILNALFSLKLGKPIGWDYNTLIEVAHMVLPGKDRSKMDPYLKYFWEGVKAYKQVDAIKQGDVSGKWQTKIDQHRAQITLGVEPGLGDPRYHKLIPFIFPELLG